MRIVAFLDLSILFIFFILQSVFMLFLFNYLFKLFYLYFCLLYWFEVFTTCLYSFVKLAHLELAEGFVIVKASISSLKARALVSSLSHVHKLIENFVCILELTMLEITRSEIKLRLIIQIWFLFFCFFMQDLLETPNGFNKVSILILDASC